MMMMMRRRRNLLPFHKQVVNEILQDNNSLTVMAKGLGLENVLLCLLRPYCDPSHLVFVLDVCSQSDTYYDEHAATGTVLGSTNNHTSCLYQWLVDSLLQQGVSMSHLPKYITNQFSSSERKRIYMDGGCLFVTNRILIVDLLSNIVPLDLVDGIFVWNSHLLTESCVESFILRVFKQSSNSTKSQFIRAFSTDAFMLSRNNGNRVSHLESVMKLLFVQRVSLWPRFRLEVVNDLERHEPEVIEITQSMTPNMLRIEQCIIRIMNSLLNQIKSNHSESLVDADEILKIENAYFTSFDRIIKSQLGPIWDSVGKTTKQMIEDLKILRRLLFYLVRYDCVTFYNYLETLKLSDGRLGIPRSCWMLTDEANDLFVYAKRRIYTITEKKSPSPSKRQRTLTQMARKESPLKQENKQFVVHVTLENNPKWDILNEVLTEIEETVAKNSSGNRGISGKVLILARDEKTCYQLNQYLKMGSRKLLDKLMMHMFKNQFATVANKDSIPTSAATTCAGNTRKRKSPGSASYSSSSSSSSLTKQEELQQLNDHYFKRREIIDLTKSNANDKDKLEDFFAIIPHPCNNIMETEDLVNKHHLSKNIQIIIESLHNQSIASILQLHEPSFIILYDSDLEVFRRLEIYKSLNPGVPLRVYITMYGSGSVEHLQYESSIKRETEAFKRLIQMKTTIAIPSTDTLLSQLSQQQQQQQQQQAASICSTYGNKISTRRAGGFDPSVPIANNIKKSKIVVDVREFRSTLPSLLNLNGMEVVPLQISVGDYIVTRDLCVERKSTSDLWQSLISGRLFTQTANMLKHYKQAALLIQFEERQSFVLTNQWEYKREVDSNLLSSKLVLLTIHFPRLKLLWSRSPNFTSKMFHMLKELAQSTHISSEPDAATAQTIGTAENEEESDMSSYAIQFLKRLPGVNEQNIQRIMTRVTNLYELSRMSLEELKEICGKINGTKLYQFLNYSVSLDEYKSAA